MAISAGQIVSVPNRELVFTQERRYSQPIHYGFVTALGEGTATVLWDTGHLVGPIPVTALDRIVQTAVDGLYRGRVVQVRLTQQSTLSQSPALACEVLDVYFRSRADAGADGQALAYCRTIVGDTYLEVPVTQISVEPGR